jgi:DNA mismatch repair protein MutL
MDARPQAAFPVNRSGFTAQDFESPIDAPPVEDLMPTPIRNHAESKAAPLVLTPPEALPVTERLPFKLEAGVSITATASQSPPPAAAADLPPADACNAGTPVLPRPLGDKIVGLSSIPPLDDGSGADSQSAVRSPQSATRNSQSAMDIVPLGQIDNSFIIAADRGALLIIDQHVAHERVLFERVLRQRAEGKVESQRLLLPIIIDLTPRQQVILENITPELSACGFEVEPFGRKTIAIKAAPADLTTADVQKLLNELLEGLEKETQAVSLTRLREKIAASVACHGAIKVNTHLDHSKMVWLIDELLKTQYPMSCPHGRPIILRYEKNDILKAFKRI